ncbi:unnamed protein product [Alopecurus aequalis]
MKTKTAMSPGKEEAEAPNGGGGFRKGPWTEQEDMKLVWFVRLLGERRWDFLAKVSGLNRTGKSCRLRWVNYLHPDLKRGRMSPDEERLVVDLHAKWGNRWSRIAKDMPGRTDNEIKNYWRTHTRKHEKTQRQRSVADAGSSSSSSINSEDDDQVHAHQGNAASEAQEPLMYNGIGMEYSNLLWNDMDGCAGWSDAGAAALLAPSSPVWDYCWSDSLWGIGDDEVEYKKMLGVS